MVFPIYFPISPLGYSQPSNLRNLRNLSLAQPDRPWTLENDQKTKKNEKDNSRTKWKIIMFPKIFLRFPHLVVAQCSLAMSAASKALGFGAVLAWAEVPEVARLGISKWEIGK